MKLQPQTDYYGLSSRTREVSGLRLSERIYPADFKTPSHSHSAAYFCMTLKGTSTQISGSKRRIREPFTTAFYPPNELQSETFGRLISRMVVCALQKHLRANLVTLSLGQFIGKAMHNNYVRSIVFLWVVLFHLVCSSETNCQVSPADKPPVVDAQLRLSLVDNIIRELRTKYIAVEKTKGIESYLRGRLQSGAYDKIEDVKELASTFTKDLRSAGEDLHLFVTYDPALEQALIAAPQALSVDLQELPPTAKSLTQLRQSNYNFRKLEIMSGNVGYLELRSFVDLNYSKETAVAAMNFLGNTDAVIIDLRHNPGGFINLEIFLASYFYGVDSVELLSRYHRDADVTVKDWTLREVPGKRLPHTDLYILTSSETSSAGEGFSFILQQRKRAKVIGEKTSGAGYGNKETPIGSGFVFFVSVFRQFDPRTGRGWQGVGVEPDIKVQADRALRVAHSEAVKNLALKATDELRKQQLTWLAALLDLDAYGAKQLSTELLHSYTGKYDGGKIVVSLEQAQLYFLGASGVRRKLNALAEDTFLIEDTSVPPENQARVRFVKNSEGKVTELRLIVADGRSFPRARGPQ